MTWRFDLWIPEIFKISIKIADLIAQFKDCAFNENMNINKTIRDLLGCQNCYKRKVQDDLLASLHLSKDKNNY